MRLITSLSCFLLLSCSLGTLAQDAPHDPFANWYGSVQYGRQNYQLFNPPKLEPWLTNERRIQLSLGYQLNPKWAVQFGWGPGHYRANDYLSGTNNAGEPVTENNRADNRSGAFSTVFRYTTKSILFSKLRLELVAGPLLLHRHNKGETIRTVNDLVTEHRTTNTRFTDWYMVAGPAVSYEFGRHFQATAELMLNKNLRGNTGYNTPVFKSFSLGVRYRFGYK